MKKSFLKGFSLVELLVVVTIIATLSVTAYVALSGQTIKARDAKRKEDLATIQQALELYFVEKSSYPSDIYAASNALIPTYMPEVPKDPGPTGNNYAYAKSGNQYELGATLEGTGKLSEYKTYIIGKCDTACLSAVAVGTLPGKYYKVGPPEALESCVGGRTFVDNATIATTTTGTCVPYTP